MTRRQDFVADKEKIVDALDILIHSGEMEMMLWEIKENGLPA